MEIAAYNKEFGTEDEYEEFKSFAERVAQFDKDIAHIIAFGSENGVLHNFTYGSDLMSCFQWDKSIYGSHFWNTLHKKMLTM